MTLTVSPYRVPADYRPLLSLRQTERAIKQIKDHFESRLALALSLERISAPLFVTPETGLNDDLNGVERKVAFDVKALDGRTVEVVQSLAKWKRNALYRYQYGHGEGIYTDMNAIRRDEDLGHLHSIYVDQWDWERVISRAERSKDFLHRIVRKIYAAMRETEAYLHAEYPILAPILPAEILFLTTQEMEDRWPELSPKEREKQAVLEHGAIFIEEIGGLLRSGRRHDGRAPDYDDWQLNGDIVFHYPVLDCAFEVSSMGIRVDEQSLVAQLRQAEAEERIHRPFHQNIVRGVLPLTIGGGIGQSRFCMFLLKKCHVGEVQVSCWPEEIVKACEAQRIPLL